MTKPKPAHELTTQGAMKRLFPIEVRRAVRAEIVKLEKKR